MDMIGQVHDPGDFNPEEKALLTHRREVLGRPPGRSGHGGTYVHHIRFELLTVEIIQGKCTIPLRF
jgi:hypothetical protein